MLSASLKSLGVTFKFDCRILAFEYHDAVPTVMLLYEKELRAQKDAPASGGEGNVTGMLKVNFDIFQSLNLNYLGVV